MYLGIDVGTSSVKAVLVDDDQHIVAEASSPLTVERPHPLWSEQSPALWWSATSDALERVRSSSRDAFAAVRGIGLSGQMHGATLLDANLRVLRPAILWNDGRSHAECAEIEAREPRLRDITGNAAMPGFTAPKLLWLERHEPAVFAKVAHVLLPKDWLRLELSGELATDASDASGTLWLDVAKRRWSEEMLAACRLSSAAMPRLFEGTQPTGKLRPELANQWGFSTPPVLAAGGGDNAAGAIGVGVVNAGQALLSLGTSGVVFLVTDRFAPNPGRGVHAFCHCIPGTWHQMSVMLSAASSLSWIASATGARNEAALLAEIEADAKRPSSTLFLPYLSGERTPHNDPRAQGVLFGLTHDTTRADLGRSVLEGVAFAFADGVQALRDAGGAPREITVIGGGSRRLLWTRILASVLGESLLVRERADQGPAFGAARLARIAVTGESVKMACPAPPIASRVEPDDSLREHYLGRLEQYRDLYRRLRTAFAPAGA
ncbi:MAG TPA: xylulokinase [Polyangiaceae bacterium]|nr:xylulokinase [Polyangiaceae bacterium]